MVTPCPRQSLFSEHLSNLYEHVELVKAQVGIAEEPDPFLSLFSCKCRYLISHNLFLIHPRVYT